MTDTVQIPTQLESIQLAPPRISRVATRRATLYYGRQVALWRCSAVFNAKEVSAVLGPNGAGKSTIMTILAALRQPSEGDVIFDDKWDGREHRHVVRQEVGLVAHDSLVYLELTGRENLEFYSRLYGDRVKIPVADWLSLVGIADAADRPVSTYSRGMRQRLSIARALIHEPSLVLMDEPLTGLDRSGQAFFWGVLAWLRREGRIVVFVTHHFDAPKGAIDRALILRAGRVRYDGPVEKPLTQVYEEALAARPSKRKSKKRESGEVS